MMAYKFEFMFAGKQKPASLVYTAQYSVKEICWDYEVLT
jgi:hypothetical protein